MYTKEKPTLNALCHVGVLGMKWGVRRGSPISALSSRVSAKNKQKLLKNTIMFSASILGSIGAKKILSYTKFKNSKEAAMVAKAIGSALGATAVSLAFDKIEKTKKGG